MIIGNRDIDHIVYCVSDLDQAMDDIKNQLGVAAVFGGYHLTQGTKNALLNLGNQCYLELLSIDRTNANIQPPRWMGIDLLNQSKITRWALKSDNLPSDSELIQRYNADMGRVEGGERKMIDGGTLRWGIAMPLSMPEVEVIPFMTDWSASPVHPTDNLPDVCRLKEIRFTHPNPSIVNPIFDQLGLETEVIISDKTDIQIMVESPNGLVQL